MNLHYENYEKPAIVLIDGYAALLAKYFLLLLLHKICYIINIREVHAMTKMNLFDISKNKLQPAVPNMPVGVSSFE